MPLKSSTMTGGRSDKHPPHQHHFYQTPENVTTALMRSPAAPLLGTRIWEPACGAGAISEVLRHHVRTVHSTDLYDHGYGETPVNFLTSARETIPLVDAIVTNPPFNHSEEFILKAMDLRVPFAFVLKAAAVNTRWFFRIHEMRRPTFILPLSWRPAMAPDRGKSPTMDFMWIAWDRHDPEQGTRFEPLPKPVGYGF